MVGKALIFGITGQDGAYLSALLLKKGYGVCGLARNTDAENCWRLKELGILHDVELIQGSLHDAVCVEETVKRVQPQEVYNLAAQSLSAHASWEKAQETKQTNQRGTAHVLESLRKYMPTSRLFQASSSEMYGDSNSEMQNEDTPFHPKNPYAVSKLEAHRLTGDYRTTQHLYACSGILFNHESPLRGLEYVSRKIADGVVRIYHKLENSITLGNLDAMRDWGFAGDYVEAMWLMLQQDTPDDFVIATGKLHSVRDMLSAAFRHIGIEEWTSHVRQDERFMRPSEPAPLCGDNKKAREELGWQPKVLFDEMMRMMVDADITRLQP